MGNLLRDMEENGDTTGPAPERPKPVFVGSNVGPLRELLVSMLIVTAITISLFGVIALCFRLA